MNALTTLPRNLAFAAAAAFAATPIVAVLRAWVGGGDALCIYAIGVSVLYVFCLARRPAAGLGAALAVGLPAMGFAAFGASPAELVFACALLIGLMRSGWLRRDPRSGIHFARAFAIEAVLVGAGLWLGAWMGEGSFFPIPMGVWSFFLVQSAFVVIGGPGAAAARAVVPTSIDPFEAAQRRARSLLEHDAVG